MALTPKNRCGRELKTLAAIPQAEPCPEFYQRCIDGAVMLFHFMHLIRTILCSPTPSQVYKTVIASAKVG